MKIARAWIGGDGDTTSLLMLLRLDRVRIREADL